MHPGDRFGLEQLDPARLAARPGVKHQRFAGELAAWVADMDFEPCPVVVEAISAQLDSGDLGYPDWRTHTGGSPVVELWAQRCSSRYGWEFDPDETREWCDVLQAVQTVVHLCTEPGDGIVLHTPSYPPLLETIHSMGRRLVGIPAIADDTGYGFDYDDLERRLAAGAGATMLLLCHPHNPTGHVFDRDELARLVEIAERYDLLIVSDEIHADLTYRPNVHLPIATLAAARTVTIHSASKAFNLAGLRYAISHVGPDWVRRRIAELPGHLLGAVNLIGGIATEAAWRNGGDWLEAVVDRLDQNRRHLAGLLAVHLPQVVYRPPQATYLAWLDCRPLGLGDDPSLQFHRRGVALTPGPDFGEGGDGFARLNFATSPTRLTDYVVRMGSPPTDARS